MIPLTKIYRNQYQPEQRMLKASLFLIGLVSLLSLGGLLWSSDFGNTFRFAFSWPWIFALALVFATPTAYYFYKGDLSLANPLILATWSYLFPSFVVGGIMLATGLSDQIILTLLQDQKADIGNTYLLIIVGYVGLAIGFMLPLGGWWGRRIGLWLPQKDFEISKVFVPGSILVILGFGILVFSFVLGSFGFQMSESIGTYDGFLYLSTNIWIEATFVLWFLFFTRKESTTQTTIILTLLATTSLARGFMGGNRGSLLTVFVIAAVAYFLAGRTITIKQSFVFGILLFLSLMIGMVYGSTFRHVKGSEARVDTSSYIDSIFKTFEYLQRSDSSTVVTTAFTNLAERLDGVSVVAVVVSNSEKLKPYEESYGLTNNIWNDFATFFIPRIIWPDKPFVNNARLYSNLYFGTEDTSFIVTPMGDLYRNYGFTGAFIGMAFFGLFLRFLYATFIENQPRSLWRSTLFFSLIISVSYESFYSSNITQMMKVGFFSIIGLLIMYFIYKALGHRLRTLEYN